MKKTLDISESIGNVHQSELSYRELADSIGDIFFAMDRDLKYIFWNKGSETLTGVRESDAVGKSIFDVFVNYTA